MLQRPEFESRPARIANYEKVIEFLAPIFKTQPRDYWEERLAALEVPHSPVFTSKEVVEGELAAHHELVIESEGPRGTSARSASRCASTARSDRDAVVPPPELGADNDGMCSDTLANCVENGRTSLLRLGERRCRGRESRRR